MSITDKKTVEFEEHDNFFCFYTNSTNIYHIIRITNVSGFYTERVIPPSQSIILITSKKAKLEIHTYQQFSAIFADTIHCEKLYVT